MKQRKASLELKINFYSTNLTIYGVATFLDHGGCKLVLKKNVPLRLVWVCCPMLPTEFELHWPAINASQVAHESDGKVGFSDLTDSAKACTENS